jgi:hypothetical protein
MKNILKFLALAIAALLSFTCSFANSVDGPNITLSTSVRKVDAGKTVKVNLTLDEAVLRLTPDQVGVDGGKLESIRKLNPTSYVLFVRASEDSLSVSVQVEADKLQNTTKTFNNYASNELTIKVIPPAPAPTVNSDNALSNLLNSVVSTVQQSQASQPAPVAQPAVTYVNCYGVNIPSTKVCTPPASYNYNSVTPMSAGYYDAYGNYYPNYSTYSSYPGVVPYSSYNAPYYYNTNPYYNTGYYTGYSVGSWFDW